MKNFIVAAVAASTLLLTACEPAQPPQNDPPLEQDDCKNADGSDC